MRVNNHYSISLLLKHPVRSVSMPQAAVGCVPHYRLIDGGDRTKRRRAELPSIYSTIYSLSFHLGQRCSTPSFLLFCLYSHHTKSIERTLGWERGALAYWGLLGGSLSFSTKRTFLQPFQALHLKSIKSCVCNYVYCKTK